MGFSMVCEGLLRAHLPDAPWQLLISKLVGNVIGGVSLVAALAHVEFVGERDKKRSG
jgi:hypothetical protein